MIDITLQNFEAELINASIAAAGAARHLGAVVRPVQDARPGAREARDRLRRPLQAGQAQRRRASPRSPQQLSQMFGVRSIPFCVLFKGGQPVDGFVGALPEARGPQVPRQARAERRRAGRRGRARRRPRSCSPRATPTRALDRLQAAVATNPANDAARYDYLRALLDAGRVAEARRPSSRWPARSCSMRAWPPPATGSRRAKRRRAARPRRRARRRDRRQQARLRRPLRAGASATSPRSDFTAGDGRAARDRDARQGLERRAGAQDLRRDPRADEQARAGAGRGRRGAEEGTLEVAGKMAAAPADPVVDAYRRKLSMALF